MKRDLVSYSARAAALRFSHEIGGYIERDRPVNQTYWVRLHEAFSLALAREEELLELNPAARKGNGDYAFNHDVWGTASYAPTVAELERLIARGKEGAEHIPPEWFGKCGDPVVDAHFNLLWHLRQGTLRARAVHFRGEQTGPKDLASQERQPIAREVWNTDPRGEPDRPAGPMSKEEAKLLRGLIDTRIPEVWWEFRKPPVPDYLESSLGPTYRKNDKRPAWYFGIQVNFADLLDCVYGIIPDTTFNNGTFRSAGGVWEVACGGYEGWLEPTRGLAAITTLLAFPHLPIRWLTLSRAADHVLEGKNITEALKLSASEEEHSISNTPPNVKARQNVYKLMSIALETLKAECLPFFYHFGGMEPGSRRTIHIIHGGRDYSDGTVAYRPSRTVKWNTERVGEPLKFSPSNI